MTVTFKNVTLDVEAENAQDAYNKLCELLAPAADAGWLEYETDRYTTNDTKTITHGATVELFGMQGSATWEK